MAPCDRTCADNAGYRPLKTIYLRRNTRTELMPNKLHYIVFILLMSFLTGNLATTLHIGLVHGHEHHENGDIADDHLDCPACVTYSSFAKTTKPGFFVIAEQEPEILGVDVPIFSTYVIDQLKGRSPPVAA